MSKLKLFGIVGVVVITGVGTGGFFLSQNKKSDKTISSEQATLGSSQTLTQTTDPNSISLNKTQPAAKPSGGLSVASGSSASNLGQLTPNSQGSTDSNSKAPSSSSALDPATFGQYDKYKEEKSALFGDLQVGTGNELTAGKKAAVYYKGWLTNGQLFDMSRPDKGGKLQPFIFEMGANQVIPGWEQSLFGMKAGGVRLLIIPPAVGYGATGQGPIPGNAVLVFQVQLLEVQ